MRFFLLGGMVRVPKVRRVVAEIFGEAPTSKGAANPDEAEAMGDAIRVGILYADVLEPLLLDVTAGSPILIINFIIQTIKKEQPIHLESIGIQSSGLPL